jgi:hypothetical protein
MGTTLRRWLLLLLLATPQAFAHIGSPDTFVQTTAGPYPILVAAHPPAVLPGALELDLRFSSDDHIGRITVSLDAAGPTPVPLVLDGTATVSLWVASPGTHTLHVAIEGGKGIGTLTLNLPPMESATNQRAKSGRPLIWFTTALEFLGIALLVLLFLRRKPRLAILAAIPTIGVAIVIGLQLRPIHTTIHTASLAPDGDLTIQLANPARRFDDLVPDHGKRLHLFLIRQPQQDVFLHLHPQQLGTGRLTVPLPAMPPGTYTLFADFYHADGSNETPTLTLTLPSQTHAPHGDPDDTTAVLPPLGRAARPVAESNPAESNPAESNPVVRTHHLPDGYSIQLRTASTLQPLRAQLLSVTLLDPAGQPPMDMQPYLGMNAHAVVLRSDSRVFAHIHPGGTLPMLMPTPMNMPGMSMDVPNHATIPYGFPSPGRYRLFVQMKHGQTVETAAFDLTVSE